MYLLELHEPYISFKVKNVVPLLADDYFNVGHRN